MSRSRRPSAAGQGAPTVAELEALKAASISQRLIRCGRLVDELGFTRVSSRYEGLRRAHLALMPYIEHHGTRASTIAERAGITKQAVSQLIGEMLDMDIVERVADPDDGRAKLVRFSANGRRAMAEGLGVLRGIDQELERALGPRRSKALLSALADVDAILSEPR